MMILFLTKKDCMMVLEGHGPRGKTWYHGCVPVWVIFKYLKIMNLELPSSDFSLWQIMKLVWSNYSDLTRPHSKWWFSKGNSLISRKSRLVKYYNLARLVIPFILPEICPFLPPPPPCGLFFFFEGGGRGLRDLLVRNEKVLSIFVGFQI